LTKNPVAQRVGRDLPERVELPRRQDYHFQVVGVGQVYLKGKAAGIAVYRVDRIVQNR
jgi:hypothetical protein